MIRWFSKRRTDSDLRLKVTPDATAAEALEQKLDAVRFQPTRGFLKDRPVEKKAARRDKANVDWIAAK